MGQYYSPIIIDEKHVMSHVNPYSFHNGKKLMEHSYIGNSVMNLITYAIMDAPHKVVWSGDYSDNAEQYYDKTDSMHEITWKDYFPNCEENDNAFESMIKREVNKCRYFINHSKKEYFDIKGQRNCVSWSTRYKLKVHPLSILTADGNGRGLGDYTSEKCKDLVGTWAYDVIEASETAPSDDYKKIRPYFNE